MNTKATLLSIVALAALAAPTLPLGASAPWAGVATHDVTLTVYHPVPAQCNARPLLTADGSKIDLRRLKAGRLRWCAVSRDLLKAYPYGSRIYVKGYGWYEVHDTTNKRLRRTVDLLLHPSDKRMINEQTTVRK